MAGFFVLAGNNLFKSDFNNAQWFRNDGRDSGNNKAGTFIRAGWILQHENGIMFAGHTGGPGPVDLLRFPKEGYTFIVLSNDGELPKEMARVFAAFYIENMPAKTEIRKFEW